MVERKTTSREDGEHREFIPVVYAKSAEEAERFRDILADHDIPAMIDEEDFPGDDDHGVSPALSVASLPVLVAEEFLDEATEVIMDCEDTEGFDVDDDELDSDDDSDNEFDFADNLDDAGADSHDIGEIDDIL